MACRRTVLFNIRGRRWGGDFAEVPTWAGGGVSGVSLCQEQWIFCFLTSPNFLALPRGSNSPEHLTVIPQRLQCCLPGCFFLVIAFPPYCLLCQRGLRTQIFTSLVSGLRFGGKYRALHPCLSVHNLLLLFRFGPCYFHRNQQPLGLTPRVGATLCRREKGKTGSGSSATTASSRWALLQHLLPIPQRCANGSFWGLDLPCGC